MKTRPPTVTLNDEQIRTFRERGFLLIDRITSPEEVSKLRTVFERLFATKAGRAEGAHLDMVTTDENDGPARLPSIIMPVNYAPELRETEFRTNALAIARQLLGPEAEPAFENAILKPPREGAPTPWHQDEATRFDANFRYEQLSIWMPLEEATIENGCLYYIPRGPDMEVLPHRSPNNDPRIHAIECAGGFDPADAIPCPLPAGGATIHHGRTLHSAGPNRSDIPRPAYILAFELPPVPLETPRDFSWNKEKRTAALSRKRSWRRRGGALVEFGRKWRSGVWRSPRRLAFEVRRLFHAVIKRA